MFLEQCATTGYEVVVGVNSDGLIKRNKGYWPKFTLEERLRLIRCLGYQTLPVLSLAKDVIEQVVPTYLAIGDDWRDKDWLATLGVDQAWMDARRMSVLYFPYTAGISTSEIRRRLSS